MAKSLLTSDHHIHVHCEWLFEQNVKHSYNYFRTHALCLIFNKCCPLYTHRKLQESTRNIVSTKRPLSIWAEAGSALWLKLLRVSFLKADSVRFLSNVSVVLFKCLFHHDTFLRRLHRTGFTEMFRMSYNVSRPLELRRRTIQHDKASCTETCGRNMWKISVQVPVQVPHSQPHGTSSG